MSFSQTLLNDVGTLVLHSLYAFAFIWFGFKLIALATEKLKQLPLWDRIDPSISGFLLSSFHMLLRIALLVGGALLIGVPGSAFITLFGSAGVAIGLALQGSLSNLAGGLMLMFFHPFSVGDYIRSGEHEGTVTMISAFYTTIVTLDNSRIVLPNGQLTNSTLTNFSAEPKRMLNLKFSVSYDSDIDLVRDILLTEAEKSSFVLKSPEPIAPIISHGESAIVFALRAWVACADFKPAEFALLESVKRSFDSHGITIPFPQMDIHIDK